MFFNMIGNKVVQMADFAIHLWRCRILEFFSLIENALHACAELL